MNLLYHTIGSGFMEGQHQLIGFHLKNGSEYSAQLSLDELFNLWESYDIKSSNIDNILFDLAKLYIKIADFQKLVQRY